MLADDGIEQEAHAKPRVVLPRGRPVVEQANWERDAMIAGDLAALTAAHED